MSPKSYHQTITFLVAAVGIGFQQPSMAVENEWTAGSTIDFSWGTAANWSLGVPTLAHDLKFGFAVPNPGVLVNPSQLSLGAGSTANSMWLSGDYQLLGGTLELGSGLIRTDLGTSTFLGSELTGTNGLTKVGGGALYLGNNANSYTGITSIANGSLIISGAGALGTSTDAVIISEVNPVIGSNSIVGFPGGSLVLDGSLGGFTLARDIHLQGNGPAGDRSGALVNMGNNTLAGALRMADGSSPRSSRVIANDGTLTISGTFNVAGTAGTHISTLGGVNSAGAGGNFLVTGELTGTGTLNKQGAGTLILSPSSTADFSGRLRISGSATGGQSSVRVFAADVFGTANAANASAPIDMNGGILEIRSDSSLDIGKNVYNRATSTYFFGPAIGGIEVNGTMNFGALRAAANTTATFNSRNGYGATFGVQTMESSNNNSTFTNNMGGLLTFTGNFWNNSDGSDRTLTISGNGNTHIEGSINTSGAGVKTLTKTGNGVLTLNGTASTLNGNLNISGGAVAIRDFRSINNSSNGIINIGSGGTAGALIIGTDADATAGGLVTNRTINLSGSTGAPSLYANQSGINPVVLNGAFTTTGGAATNSKTLTLGGTNTADNIIHGNISNQAVSTTGVVSVLKTGPGTWVLAGANTYTGTTTISNGTLKLQANAAVSTVLPGTNAITFGANNTDAGGTLEFVGQPGVDNVQNLGTLTYASGGAATLKVTPGVGGTASLTFANLPTGGSATLNIVGADFLNNKVTFTQVNAAVGSDGILTRSVYWNGADYAYREGGVMRAPVYGVDAGTATSASGFTGGIHNEMTGSFSSNSVSLTTLKIAGSQTLTINEGQTLSMTSVGGVLATGGISSVIGGTINVGTGVLVNRVNLASDVLEIGSIITGTGGLTKVGEGKLILSGVNTRTGTTNIHEGMVQLYGSGTLSGANAALTIRSGAVLDLNGVSTGTSVGSYNNNGIVTNSNAAAVTFQIGNNNGTGTSFGTIEDGVGIIHVTKVGTGAQTWLGKSTYTGVTTIGSTGLVTVDTLANGGMASGIGASSSDAANLVFNGSTGGLSYRGNLYNGILNLGSTSATTDRLFTVSGSGVTLGSSPSTNLNNAIVWSNTGAIVHGTNADRTFIFTGTSQGDNTFNPQLTDSTGFTTTVTKTGTGIWRLGNSANTYSGATTITQGILMATDGQGLSPNSNLVFDGGALYSQGTLNRNIGTGPGEMQFATPLTDTAQFSGGFMGGDEKLTVTWSGTPAWGSTPGFIDNRNGLILNGSQARAQGATGSIALSEVELASDFSLGTASGAGLGPALSYTIAQNSSTVTVASTAGLVVGQSVTGTNIPSGAFIMSILSATQFQMSASTPNVSGTAGTYLTGEVIANNLRPIRVDDNGSTGADFATISGNISAGDAVTGIRKLGGGVLRLSGDNTYAGETNLNQGTLALFSLGHSSDAPNTPTSVGVSGVPFNDSNAITLGNGGTGAGILQYLGGGETSDRKIRMNTTTGSNQIHADGTGPLILTNVTNDVITATGNKTLFLRGNNTQGNMVTSQLSDNGGTLGVTVDGGATWILTNPLNNYTGITTAGGGALGIGHDTAIGGILRLSNGSVFAFGGDRTLANPVDQANNTTGAFIGDHSLTFTSAYALLATTSNPSVTTNNIVAGKTLTFGGVTANAITANRTWTIEGNGETIIDGDITTSTTFGLPLVKTGDGILQLNGTGSNFNQNNANVDIDRGTLRLGASEVIPHGVGFGGLLINPELANGDTAIFDLNGFNETVNTLSSTTDGTAIIDNTSANASSLTFGANDAVVNFGTGTGTYSITNSGGGALSLVKTGTGIATLGGGVGTTTLSYTGSTTVEGGVLNVAAGISSSTGISVAGGAALNLFNGVADDLTGLTTLSLGVGAGATTLGMEVGADLLTTDRLTIAGAATTANSIQFDIRNLAGFGSASTYDLISAGSGLDGATYSLNNMPGGFTYVLNTSGTLVQLGVTAIAAGELFWQGDLSGSWSQLSGANSNFSTDLLGTLDAGASPGVANTVVFGSEGATGPSIVTTLDNNYFVNALEFSANPAGVTSVAIAPGTFATNTLTITPVSSLEGIDVADNAGAVTISAPVALGAPQTWNVVGTGVNGSSLTVSGAVSGSADLTKTGDGVLTLSANNDLYLGSTTISAGTLNIGAGGATGSIGTGDILNNGALVFNRDGTFVVPNLINGTGSVAKSDGGFMTLANTNNSFSGDVIINAGTLAFSTVSNIGGPASSLGQGNAINMTGGTLRFVGDAVSQSTDRPIITSVGNAVLSLGGTNGASMTFAGAITIGNVSDGSKLTLTGTAGSEGFITGGFTMTGTASDGSVTGGTWTLSGAQNTVADNLTVTGTSTILNLNDTSILRFLSGATSGDIYINNGAIVNIGAENAIDMTIPYRLFIGQTAGGATGVLNLGTNNLTSGRFILGERANDRNGIVNGTGTLTVSDGDLDLYEGEINANLASAGTLNFDKFGPGTVTLRGDNSGLGSTGASVVNEGTLVLDYTVSNTTKLRSSSALSMVGGDLLLIGNDSAATTQFVSSFTLGSGGSSTITLDPGEGQEIALHLGAITRANGAQDGTIRFNLPAGVQSATNGFTTTAVLTNGLLGLSGFATVADSSGTWFATTSDGNIVGLVSTAKNDVSTWLPGDHVTDEAGGFRGVFGGSRLASLRFNAAESFGVNLGGVRALNIASGGILVTDNVSLGNPGIHNGVLSAGVTELIVTQDSSQLFEISASIGINHAVTKSGTGALLLSGWNNYTDETEIQEGTLIVHGGNAIGDTSLVSLASNRNSTLQLAADETIGRLSGGKRATNSEYGTVAVGAHTLTINQSGNTTYAGMFTGTGTIILNTGSVGNLNMQNNSSGFTGEVVINGGLMILSNIGQNNASSFTINKGGTLLLDMNGTTRLATRILDTAAIVLNSADGGFSGATITLPRGLGIRTDQASTNTEVVGIVTANSGANYVTLEATTVDDDPDLRMSDLIRNNNATLNVRGTVLGLATANVQRSQFEIAGPNEALFIANPANLSGAGGAAGSTSVNIVPWAIGESFAAGLTNNNMGNSFVTYEAGSGFRPLDLVTEYAPYATAAATDNVRESFTADIVGLTGSTFNSVALHNNTFVTTNLNITGTGAGQMLTNTSGAFLFTTAISTSTTVATTVSGFDDGIAVGGNEYVMHVVNPSAAANSVLNLVTVSSPLVTAADLTKSGRGTLVLTAVNTAGGGTNKTTINEGILEISDLDHIGGDVGGLVFAGGTLRLGAGLTDDISLRTVSFLTGGGTLDTNGIDLALTNGLGSGDGSFTKTGLGNLTLNAATTLTGSTSVVNGVLTLGTSNAIGSGDLNVFAGATLDVGTNDITVGRVTTSGASPLINGTGVITSTLGFVFSHTGDVTVGASLAGSVGMFKNQNSVLTLSGASTYTGITEVQAGSISFDSIGNVAGSPSALGAPINEQAGMIRMGLTTAATALTYTGLGHDSDRLIGLQGTTGGLTVNADGTGAVGFGGVTGLVAGVKTLTLTGTADPILINAMGGIVEGVATLSVVKAGTATWLLDGPGTYSGTTTVNAGILQISNDLALGSSDQGTIINASSTLQLVGDITVGSEALTLTGVGSAGQLGALVNVSGDNTFSGPITLNGPITFASEAGKMTLGDVTSAGGNLAIVGAGDTTLGGNLDLTAGALSKSGAGTLVLLGENVILGGAVLSEGILEAGSTGALGVSGAITFDGGTLLHGNANTEDYSARLSFNPGAALRIATDGQTVVYNNSIGSVGGSLVKSGPGTLVLAAASFFDGATSVLGGRLAIDSEDQLGPNPLVVSAAQLLLDGGALNTTADLTLDDLNRGVTLGAAGGAFDTDSNTTLNLALAVAGPGQLVKDGLGTLLLNSATAHTGGTLVQAGTLRIGVSNAVTGDLALTGNATLDVDDKAVVVTSLAVGGSGSTVIGSGSISSTGGFGLNPTGDTTISTSLAGTGALTKTGAGTAFLTADNTFTGGSTISEGALFLDGGSLATGPVSIASAASFGGVGSVDGPVNLLNGTGTGAGEQAILNVGAGVQPGLNLLTLEDSLTLGDFAIIDFYLSKTGFTKLDVEGTATFAANSRIRINLDLDYIPSEGSAFDLLDWGALNLLGGGTLVDYLLTPLPDLGGVLWAWDTSTFAADGVLRTTGTPAGPAVITDPMGGRVIFGDPVTFTVDVTGSDPMTVQWFKGVGDSNPIAGANALSYTIPAVSEADAGSYWVRITNGLDTEDSQLAVLDVVTTPRIDVDPAGAVLFPSPGTDHTFSVTAVGPGTLSYVWNKNGVPIPGAPDAPDYTISDVAVADSGNYTVTVSNSFGDVTSAVAVLVVQQPIVIDTHPQAPVPAVPEGNEAQFNVVASGDGPFTYQWEFDALGGAETFLTLDGETQDTLSRNVEVSTLGSYRVVVSNAYASLTSNAATLAFGNPQVVIDTQPISKVVALGSTLELSVVSSGGKPQTFQWYFKGKPVPDETDATLSLQDVTTAQVGQYFCRISNALVSGSTTVDSAIVTVAVVDQKPGRFVLIQPGTVNLSVKATSHISDPLTYQWFLDEGLVSAPNPQPIAGATAKTLKVTNLTNGQKRFFCRVSAGGGSRFLDGGDNMVFIYNQAPALQPEGSWTLPDTMVSQPYAFQVPMVDNPLEPGQPDPLRMPVSFKAVGLPKGLTINSAGLINGRATVEKRDKTTGAVIPYVVTITATNKLGTTTPIIKNLLVNPLDIGLIGAFTGPVDRNASLNGNLGGAINFTTSKTGTYSGKLTMGAKTYAFKGALDSAVSDPSNPSVTVKVSRGKTLRPLLVSFKLNTAGLVTGPTVLLTRGTITDGRTIAEFDGWRNTWLKTAANKTPALAYSGYYTLGLELPLLSQGNTDVPQGTGYASFTVNSGTGKLNVVGKLSDGTAFTSATYVGPTGQVAVFKAIYAAKTRGSVVGTLTIDQEAPVDINDNTLAGIVSWWKPAQAGRAYAAGFGSLDLEAVGSRYNPPAALTPVMNITPPLAAGQINALVELVAANVETAIPQTTVPAANQTGFSVSTANKAVADPMNNPRKMTLVINAKTGAISGKFTLSAPHPFGDKPAVINRVVSYFGLIINNGSVEQGWGYFLLPQLPANATEKTTATPILSGQAVFEKIP